MLPHEIVRPDGDAARRDEDVGLEPALERGAMRRLVVGNDRQQLDLGARGGERGGEHERVRLVDLARRERLAGLRELGAGGEDRDAWASHARDRREARRGQRAELRRADPDALPDDHVARMRVAARADERARPRQGSVPP